MEEAFRQAFAHQARKRLKLDREVIARFDAEPGSLAVALERAGLIDAAGWRNVYEGVRAKLLIRNVQHHRDAADRALLRLAVRCGIVSGDGASQALARWNERPTNDRPRLSQDLVDTAVMTAAQRDELARRLDAEQVACSICGFHLDRLAIAPGLACPRCGWPELVGARDAPPVSPATWTGRMVGGWTLVERIGQGGLGRVFYARHPEHGEGAFKVLSPEAAADARWLARFEREARAAAAIDHPGVVRILDVGKDEELPFLVMEWVDGESLAQFIDRAGPLEVVHAVQVARRLAGALAAAHAAGIVHRDVKPGNVLLDRRSRAKLADFGLAREVGDLSVSQVGAVIGSPGYMSPEQVQGHAVDFRTDVFSLGVLIHTMIAGKSPLSRPAAMDSLRATVNERVPPLSRATPSVSPLLDALVLEMTHRDVDRRTASMATVIERLERMPGGVDPEDRPAAAPPTVPPAVSPAVAAPTETADRGVAPVVPAPAGRVGSRGAARVAASQWPPARIGGVLAAGAVALAATAALASAVWPSPPDSRDERAADPTAPAAPDPPATPPDPVGPVGPAGSGSAAPVDPPVPGSGPASGSAGSAAIPGATLRPGERLAAERELAERWAELIDDPRTPTRERHARWCALEEGARPALRALMIERRPEAFTDLHIQALNEVERTKPVLQEAIERARWDDARRLLDELPEWSAELARIKARLADTADAGRYAAALAQVVALVRADPDRARAAITAILQHPLLAAQHGRRVTADVDAAWVNALATVVEACESGLDRLAVPCALGWTAADGAAVQLELTAVRPARSPTGEPSWGRELVGTQGGKPVVLTWAQVPREQKARWALAELRRRNVAPAERRRLVAQYLKAGGVPAARAAGALDSDR